MDLTLRQDARTALLVPTSMGVRLRPLLGMEGRR